MALNGFVMNILDAMFGNDRFYYELPYPFPPILIEYADFGKHLGSEYKKYHKKAFRITTHYEEIEIGGELRESTGFYAIVIEFRWSRLTFILN